MKSVFTYTNRPSDKLVCHIHGTKISYPTTWPRPIPEQFECKTIEDIKSVVAETNAELVNFYFRSNGIPNRPVKVADVEKLNKAYKALEKMLSRTA